MIDTTKLSENWGYDPKYIEGTAGNEPQNTTAHKQSITRKPDSTTVTSETSGGNMANNSFQYPSQWGTASDLWTKMAQGNYSNTGMDYLSKLLAGGGNPVDVQGWASARRPAMMDEYSNMVKEMAEQAGVGGVRYGSGLQGQISNYGGQLMNQFNQQMADKWMGSQENAMSRALSGAGTLGGLGMQGAATGGEGLMSLGNMYAQLPMQVASQMGGLGQSLTNQQIDPWTQMLAGLIGNTNATAQTYTPSGLQSFLQGIMPGLSSAFSGGYGGTPASAIDMTGTGGILPIR